MYGAPSDPEPIELENKKKREPFSDSLNQERQPFDRQLVAWLCVVCVVLFVGVPITVIVACQLLTEPKHLVVRDEPQVYVVRHAAFWISAIRGEVQGPGIEADECVYQITDNPLPPVSRCACHEASHHQTHAFVRNLNALQPWPAPVHLQTAENCTDGYEADIVLVPRWYMMLLAVLIASMLVTLASFICCFTNRTTSRWCRNCFYRLPDTPHFQYQRVNRQLGFYGGSAGGSIGKA